MDYVYQPDVAAQITAWVAYITLVPACRDTIVADASKVPNPATQHALTALADSPWSSPHPRNRRPCTRTRN